jgi:hypothetical protein
LFAEPTDGHPGIPSVIVTANRVDQFLSNTGSFSGSFTGNLIGTASYATQALSASYAPAFPYTGSARITGSLEIKGSFNQASASLASGLFAYAQGFAVTASGIYSHAEGQATIADGLYSHAEGEQTTAPGQSSHAEGYNTIAQGNYSHAEGRETTATGNYSHAEGWDTIASGDHQHVQGQYNISSSAQSAFIVGNGTGPGALRSNLIFASGSQVQVTGSVIATAGFTGSLQGTATTASYATVAQTVLNASLFALVGSPNTFTSNQIIQGYLTLQGSLNQGTGVTNGNASHAQGNTTTAGYYGYYSGTTGVTAVVLVLATADGDFTSDDLAYMVRNRRTISVYGMSPVERALPLADIYLRRQQWIRAEYTDGVLPELLFTTDATFGNNPELLRAYENIFNDDLAGQTAQRKRARLLPAGMTPIQYDGYGEKFKDVLDNYLITSICGHFGVLPSEIGFSGSGSLGASGLQQGESLSAEIIGIQPLADWISRQLTNLSYLYLGMPRELEFKILFESKIDTESEARRVDIELKNGGRTVNEARSTMGLPLLDTPQADMPMLYSGSGLFFLSPDGIIDAYSASGASALSGDDATPVADQRTVGDEAVTETGKPTPNVVETMSEDSASPTQEVKKFLKWMRKGNFKRPFNFEIVETEYAEVINKYIAIGDTESAKWYAERYIGL